MSTFEPAAPAGLIAKENKIRRTTRLVRDLEYHALFILPSKSELATIDMWWLG